MTDGDDLVARATAWVEDVHPHARHLTRTLDWVLELDPAASEALRIAAVTHDIERAYPDDSAGWDPPRDWDSPEYNRWHQDRCADIVARWLRDQGAEDSLVARVRDLVAVHEEGGWPEADLLQAADSLSFLETLVPLVVGWVEQGRAPRERAAGKLHHSADRIAPDLAAARAAARPMLEAGLETLEAADSGDVMTQKTVALVGTLDTKGPEYEYLRKRLRVAGVTPLLVDVGTHEPRAAEPDVTREQVAEAGGVDLAALAERGDRGETVGAMARAAAVFLRQLYDQGRCDGVLAAGGSGNTAIATAAMRALPVGVPKLMVSTVAAGDTNEYIGSSDLMLMASVTDVAGVNSISARILANAAAAMAGMVTAPPVELGQSKPLVGATMFGVTTPGVTAAREELERRGYEVLTFHATGTGGRAMESLVESGFLQGVLDITTTELADELVGGVFSAGPERLEVAGRLGLPQVVSLGALDMVNFGSRETVPERFEGRNLYVHNPQVTLMRTTPEECAELGRRIARKLSAATGPVALFVPLRGVSMLSTDDAPFHDPAADEALFSAIRDNVGGNVELHEEDLDINDPAFAAAMAQRLDAYLEERVPA